MVYREEEREEFEKEYRSLRRRESGGQYNPNLVYGYRTFSELSPFCFDLKSIINNETNIEFSEAYYKNNIEEGDGILISKIRGTLKKVQLPEECFPDNFSEFFREFHYTARRS